MPDMARELSSVRSNKMALRTQEQFEAYLLALTFTLLAAAMQTAKSGQVLAANLAEWFGWLTLFVSGLLALRRFERRSLPPSRVGPTDSRGKPNGRANHVAA